MLKNVQINLVIDPNLFYLHPVTNIHLAAMRLLTYEEIFKTREYEDTGYFAEENPLQVLRVTPDHFEKNRIHTLPTAAMLPLRNLQCIDALICSAEYISDEIALFPHLQMLHIAYSNLNAISEAIGKLKEMKWLLLPNNKLKSLPSSLIALTELRSLDVNDNELTQLPDLRNFTKLEVLQIGGNSFGNLDEIFNQISELPLTELNISGFGLRKFPSQLLKLKRLKRLDLGSNPFDDIPEEVFQFPELESLSMYATNLSEETQRYLKAKEKYYLNINDTPLKKNEASLQIKAKQKAEEEAFRSALERSKLEACVWIPYPNKGGTTYEGLGIQAAEHPLNQHIAFIEKCPSCGSSKVLITQACHQVHPMSGDAYYDYAWKCLQCQNAGTQSGSEN